MAASTKFIFMESLLNIITSDPRLTVLLAQDHESYPDLTKELLTTDGQEMEINNAVFVSAVYKLFGVGRCHQYFTIDEEITYPGIITVEVDDNGSGGVFICMSRDDITYAEYRAIEKKLITLRLSGDELSTWLINSEDKNNRDVFDWSGEVGGRELSWNNHGDIEFSWASARHLVDMAQLKDEFFRAYHWLTGLAHNYRQRGWNNTHLEVNCKQMMTNLRRDYPQSF